MTLKEIRDDYVRYSSNVSELCRNLTYAGIGIVWIFKQTNSEETPSDFFHTIPNELKWPLILFVVVLIIDLFQYFIQTIIWYPYYTKKKKEHKTQKEDDVNLQEPESYNIIPWCFWGIKFLLVLIAYFIMGCFLLK